MSTNCGTGGGERRGILILYPSHPRSRSPLPVVPLHLPTSIDILSRIKEERESARFTYAKLFGESLLPFPSFFPFIHPAYLSPTIYLEFCP